MSKLVVCTNVTKENPIFADAHAIPVVVTCQLLDAVRPWVDGERVDPGRNPALNDPGKFLERASGGRGELDPIGHGSTTLALS